MSASILHMLAGIPINLTIGKSIFLCNGLICVGCIVPLFFWLAINEFIREMQESSDVFYAAKDLIN